VRSSVLDTRYYAFEGDKGELDVTVLQLCLKQRLYTLLLQHGSYVLFAIGKFGATAMTSLFARSSAISTLKNTENPLESTRYWFW
jgi:hypothetical protein